MPKFLKVEINLFLPHFIEHINSSPKGSKSKKLFFIKKLLFCEEVSLVLFDTDESSIFISPRLTRIYHYYFIIISPTMIKN